MTYALHLGDCRDVLRGLADASVDAIVTDPPYGLEFMGKDWDAPWKGGDATGGKVAQIGQADGTPFRSQRGTPAFGASGNPACANCGGDKYRSGPRKCVCRAPAFPNHMAVQMRAFQSWCEEWARECLRVLKPGGHLLAFGGSRTYHRLACAVEDAGFEVRDQIMWIYGSGFPKSLDVSKAIDSTAPRVGMFDAFAAHFAERWTASGMSRRDFVPHFPHYKNAESVMAQLSNWKLAKNVPSAQDFVILRALIGMSDDWRALIEREEAQREKIGEQQQGRLAVAPGQGANRGALMLDVTAPATDAARQWAGWGTALKPAHEPIVVARKPLAGTVAANVLAHGTGALNVDGCRIGTNGEGVPYFNTAGRQKFAIGDHAQQVRQAGTSDAGRWPANVIHDGSEEVVALFPQEAGGHGLTPGPAHVGAFLTGMGGGDTRYADTGSAARFFYCAKASAEDRDEGLHGFARQTLRLPDGGGINPMTGRPVVDIPRRNVHPTVKPTDLMRYLVRLVTPPGGTVLDPFMGSGSTGKAAVLEGFDFIGCELSEEYIAIARARIEAADRAPKQQTFELAAPERPPPAPVVRDLFAAD